MKLFLGLLVLCGAALGRPEDPEIVARAPSTFQNCDCQCDSYTWSSKGRVLGNCYSPDGTGANFCYISGRAVKACRDVQISESRADSFSQRGKFYSYEACATPPRNQCYGSGGPHGNFGDGDFNGFGGGVGYSGGLPPPVRPGGIPPISGGGGFGGGGFGGGVGYSGATGARPPSTNLASILGIRSGANAGGEEAVNA